MFDDNLTERYELAFNRITEIAKDCAGMKSPAADYFKNVAEFIINMDGLLNKVSENVLNDYSLEQLQSLNEFLYRDILEENYDKSYANPAYACMKLGEGCGKLLSFLYVEIRGMIVFAYEQRRAEFTTLMELFIEIYCMFEDEEPAAKSIQQSIYWYVSDYSDEMVERRIEEQLNPELDFAKNIIMNSDLSDLRYLYSFGEYITDNEIKTALYLNTLTQSQIEDMAHTFTEGYRKGFELGNKDLSKKKTVNIRYHIGFERLVREEIPKFEEFLSIYGIDIIPFFFCF